MADDMQAQLGARLRATREARRLSLRSVAGAVGISPSLLSQVETGKTHPSVSTLYSLVTHLGVSIDDLLAPASRQPAAVESRGERATAPDGEPAAVQRSEENPVIEMENGVTWERLAAGGFGLVDPLVTTYAPGGSSSTEGLLMRHSGVEYGYLVEGELTLRLDVDTYVLRAGDSVCFSSVRPHLYVNHSDAAAKGVWFVVGGDGGNGAGLPPDPGTGGARSGTARSATEALSALWNRGPR